MTAELLDHFDQMIYDERWLSIPGFDWYEISNRGNVRTVAHVVIRSNGCRYQVRGRLRRICVDKRDGLKSVKLATGRRGRYRTIYPDRLAERLFGGDLPNHSHANDLPQSESAPKWPASWPLRQEVVAAVNNQEGAG